MLKVNGFLRFFEIILHVRFVFLRYLMFGVDLRFSSAFCCIGFAACSAESWNRNFFACFFNLFVCFFAFCFCKFAISKQDLWESWKNTKNTRKFAKKMRKTCNTNCKKDATQAKKTLKLETKTLFLHVFVSDISLFFLGLSRVSLGF